MEKENQEGRRRSLLPLALTGGGGAALGYHLGKGAAPAVSVAVEKLAQGLISQATLSTAGPVIAAGVTGACAIIAAVAVPVTIVWILSRKERE